MNQNTKIVCLLFLIIVAFSGCQKERPHPSWNVDLLAPLLIDTVTIFDIISDTLIEENPDNSITFVFDKKLYEVNVDSLVMLPDTLFSWSFSLQYLPNPIPLEPGDTIIEEIFDWPLDFSSFHIEGVELENAVIRSGEIKFEVLDQSEGDLLCVFGINSAVRNEADTFMIAEKVPAGQNIDETYDFSKYRLDLRGSEGIEYNMLNYYLALIVHPDEQGTVYLNPADSFAINIYFENIVIDYAKGYFGQNTFGFGPELYDFSLFDDLEISGFSMKDATVFLRIENNYGVEGLFKIIELLAINSSTNKTVQLMGEMVDSNLFIDRAIQTGNGLQIIDPFIQTYDFSNSNFTEMIEIMPDKFSYTIQIQSNIFGDSTNHDNFFYYDEPIRVYMEAEVTQGVIIEDMFIERRETWNGEGVKLDNITEGHLILIFKNGFPFSFDMNLFLENETMETIDTLLYDAFITGAQPGADQKVEEPAETRISIVLTDNLKKSIKEAKYGYYELLINSIDDEHVKIYSDYIMELKINGDFQFIIQQ